MEPASALYEDAALCYTALVRQVSRDAADAIEQIHDAFGARASLRAALIIALLKMEVHDYGWVSDIDGYEHLLEDYPDALPLTKYAMACCLRIWAISMAEAGNGHDWQSHELRPKFITGSQSPADETNEPINS